MGYESKPPLFNRRGIASTPIVLVSSCCAAALGWGLWLAEHNQKASLEQERSEGAVALDQARGQIRQLNDRLNAMEAAQRQFAAQAAVKLPTDAPNTTEIVHSPPRISTQSVARTAGKRRTSPVRTAQVDPRVDRLQGQLSETQKELASTRDELARNKQELDGRIDSTRDDLNGSIARTHDDVVALQKRGEHNIYEFKLTKTKEMQRVGPLSLSLRSTSTKHKTFDFVMVVDDNSLNKKHVNLYEPVWITLNDRPQPVELVVNHVGKDEVTGYLSEPKYRNSELSGKAEQVTNASQSEFATRGQTASQKQ